MKINTIYIFALKTILFLIMGCQFTYGQIVNSITIQPSNPTSDDTIVVVSDFSYNGNCAFGLVTGQIVQTGSFISIYPEYCGYGDSTLCNAVDSFSVGSLPAGNYTLHIEYHQGTVCGGGFDTIIANYDTTFQVGSPLSIDLLQMANNEISVYPNPTVDFVTIQHKTPINAIALFDLTGKELHVSHNDTTIEMRSLNPGVYLLQIEFENGVRSTQKIIKK